MPRINFGTEEKKEETKTKKPMNAIGYYILVILFSIIIVLSAGYLGVLFIGGKDVITYLKKYISDEVAGYLFLGSIAGILWSSVILAIVMRLYEPKKTGEETKTTTA